jgi:hypothetical protein
MDEIQPDWPQIFIARNLEQEASISRSCGIPDSRYLALFVRRLFGPESREIAGGYRLKRADNPNQFAMTIPYEDGGLIIDEIGWHEPLIFARALGSQYWDVINTAQAQHSRVSDMQRKSDPISQSIQIKSAATAWKELNRHNRLW